ncbi:M91 family zinc metallopeptidase [Corallococcus sp. BB11-1]|uniref:M91 family zinc metallopeptidase n=1 Tax=Corallococcus sp. BB11-1 TaxID=2996783 RepID=UPI002271B968|nr:M91 family zinc metallopeptidase [Corallococcus sp. BB11-1]MCY1035914.1 M91 family zinc metallopeptidase [Corallococcus sp. BB11-1]
MKLRAPSFSKPSSSSSSSPLSRPRSNSLPARPENATPKAPVSPSELKTGKDNLKPTDYGVVDPKLQGIRTRRDSGQSGADFADFTQDVRNSTNRLTSKPVGNQMLTELNGRTQAVNPGATGTLQKPLTVVDISSGRNSAMPMAHAPRNDGTLSSVRPAYRFDGQPGAGTASNIKYNEKDSGQRFNSLGHESVHAWRAANGVQVSPLAASKHSDADVFKQHPAFSNNMKDTVDNRLRLTEEFETVGLRPTPHTKNNWAPSENAIRAEHGLPSRQDYSGLKPDGKNSNDEAFKNFDEGTDTRNFFQRLSGTPSPFGKIVGDLEK